ncbi:MAG: RsmD family RNA methyltransferase, partial [Phaeodactylibacter sp.]|nr:RsmD family RNA methyltransferase [Phaeodactylibacter sp.]
FPPAVAFVKKIAAELGIQEAIRIVRADVYKFISSNTLQFDYIFAGPPYPLPDIDTLPETILQARMLKLDGLLVMEHNPNHSFQQHPCYQEERHYGTTIFSFFRSLDLVTEEE